MSSPQPTVGEWYRIAGGERFEVVALDDADRTIEIQYFDGTVAELDLEDWDAQCEDGSLEGTGPPEDWSGSVDVEPDTDDARPSARDRTASLQAGSLDGLDLFDAR